MVDAKKLGLFGVGGLAIVAVISTVVFLTTKNSQEDLPQTLARRAQSVLERMPVIDGHNDFPWNLRKLTFNDLRKVNFSSDLTQDPVWGNHPESFTDIPRLRQGQVGGQFWVAYTSCASNYKDSVSQTLEQIDVIKRLVQAYPNDLQFAASAAEIEAAIENKKIASLIAVEGGHSIQSSFSILRLMYEMGARYMTLTHSCNLPWADASPVDGGTIEPVNGGLSPFGLQMIDEMNRLGMMVDLSHVSSATMKAAINRSKAPVIFSHSSAKAICNHHRNVPDDVLLMVAQNQGIVMVNFFRHFIQCDRAKNATLADVVEHINHIRRIAGVDFIGIGADFDGIDEVPQGITDVSSYPLLFEALLETGTWTEEDLEKLSGRNILRVFKEVERVRDQLQSQGQPPEQDVVKKADIVRAGINTTCVSAPFIDDPATKDETKDGKINSTADNSDENVVASKNRERREAGVLSFDEVEL